MCLKRKASAIAHRTNKTQTALRRVKYPAPLRLTSDFGSINGCSYLHHEFEQAKKKKKTIIIVYNSTRKEANWLPSYMSGYEDDAKPFWKYDASGKKVGDYAYIKEALGF